MGVKDLFELHIYTMGSRSYARKVPFCQAVSCTRYQPCIVRLWSPNPALVCASQTGSADHRSRPKALPREHRFARRMRQYVDRVQRLGAARALCLYRY
jgi:hypothetical protein